MDEAFEVITRLWAGENVDFEGAPLAQGRDDQPAPEAEAHAALARRVEAAIRRTARYGHGWLAPLQTPEEAGVTVADIKSECEKIGRPIPDDHHGATILFRIGDGGEAGALPGEAGKPDTPAAVEMRSRIQRMQAIGDAETVLERIEFGDHGVTKFIAIPMAKTADDMIEQCRRLSEEVIPHAS